MLLYSYSLPGGKLGGCANAIASNSAGVQTLAGSCVYGRRDYGVVGVIVEAAAHFQQLGDSDVVAVGHARDVVRHWIVETSLPSCASCRITAAVIVLVFEAIRKWVSARGGFVVPSKWCRRWP